MDEPYLLAVVGAGLSALSALRAGIVTDSTALVEYQQEPGGFLAPALPDRAFEHAWDIVRAPYISQMVTAYFGATAVGLLPGTSGAAHTLLVRRRAGAVQIRAHRILLACGGLELTREAALIPGTRPSGVITPVLAHQLLARGYLPGRRAVVHGAGCYAAATARRLAAAGVAVLLVPPLDAVTPADAGVPVDPPAEIVEVLGFPRLTGIRLRRAGRMVDLPADTLVMATGMVANTRWLKGSDITCSPDGSILVDERYCTSVPGIFAVGTAIAPDLDHARSVAGGQEIAAMLISAS